MVTSIARSRCLRLGRLGNLVRVAKRRDGCTKMDMIEVAVHPQARDYSGQRYGKLVAVRRIDDKRHRAWLWAFRCDCGAEEIRLPSQTAASVQAGHMPSCSACWPEPSNKLPLGEASKGLLFRRYKRGAARRGFTFDLTRTQFLEIVGRPCFYCDCVPSSLVDPSSAINGRIAYNGLDRVDNRMGYAGHNVVACCAQCNRAKGAMTREEFMSWLRRAAHHSLGGNGRS